jgi:glycosyltransferase involved in cell wall biosynthesis
MKNPKFTVIIPTRERLSTLIWSIQTLTEQQYDDLEIIISDNFSQDGTRDYIKSLTDPRIRYINTGKRVSMTENWEFALNHATGEFVTYVGDDDGLAIGALAYCEELLSRFNTKALAWKKATYLWNTHQASYLANTVELPSNRDVKQVDAKKKMEAIITFREHTDYPVPAYFLPCLYNSFINREVLLDAKEKQGGRFFHSRYPDIYSSFLLPFFLDSYVFSFCPVGVGGTSGNSNGGGSVMLTLKKKHTEAELFEKENTIDIHPRIRFVDFASIPFIMMECYLQACDSLRKEPVYFDLQKLADEALRYATRFTPETIPWTIQSIDQTFKLNGLPYEGEKVASKLIPAVTRRESFKSRVLSILRSNKLMYLSYLRSIKGMNYFLLKKSYPQNILGACRLVGKKFGFK